MALIEGQRGQDIGNAIARALQMIGATGRPQIQAGLLQAMQMEAEQQRRANQFRGLLAGLDQQPGGAAFDAASSPPIQSGAAASGGLLDPIMQKVRDPASSVAMKNPTVPLQTGLLPETGQPQPGMSGGGSGILPDTGGGLSPQERQLAEFLGPEEGTKYLLSRMGREQQRPRIVQGPDGVPYYETGEPVLPGMKAPEKVPEMRQDAAGYWRYVAGPQAGQRVFPGVEKPSETKEEAVNIRLPNGTLTPGYERSGRLYYLDRDNQFRPAPFGASKAGVALSGTEASADKVRARKFREYEDAADNFMRYGTSLVNTIDSGSPVFGVAGWMAQTANSVRAQAEGVIRGFGGYTDEKTGKHVTAEQEAAEFNKRLRRGSKTWDRLRKVTGDRADVLGTGIALAYMRAKMLDPQGRVSDADLENSVRSLGFDTSDPQIIRQRIVDEMNLMNRSYQARAEREDIASPQRFTVPGNKQDAKRKRLIDRYGLE